MGNFTSVDWQPTGAPTSDLVTGTPLTFLVSKEEVILVLRTAKAPFFVEN